MFELLYSSDEKDKKENAYLLTRSGVKFTQQKKVAICKAS